MTIDLLSVSSIDLLAETDSYAASYQMIFKTQSQFGNIDYAKQIYSGAISGCAIDKDCLDYIENIIDITEAAGQVEE